MIRYNILTNDGARGQFIEGCLRLKEEPLGASGLFTYDYFVWWHHRAMMAPTPDPAVASNSFNRNGAHSGPVFGPWHRYLLLIFEFQMRRVLNEDDFRLPYWDWGTETGSANAIWTAEVMGDPVGVVNTGAFRDGGRFAVNIAQDGRRDAFDIGTQPLRRDFGGADVSSPPSNADVRNIVAANPIYAASPWNDSILTAGFRRPLEVALHNRIHRLVGGHMMDSTSPNDPVFWLHHTNLDRIWSAWQAYHNAPYLPQNGPEELNGHRYRDRMHSFMNQTVTPEMVDNHTAYYTYDTRSNVTP